MQTETTINEQRECRTCHVGKPLTTFRYAAMGLFKRCPHVGRSRDRCEHGWWGSFRGRVSLTKWTGREIRSKAEADAALDELRAAIREGTFDERGLQPPPARGPLSFREFAKVYKERHVIANGRAMANTIDYRLKPLLAHIGDRPQVRSARPM